MIFNERLKYLRSSKELNQVQLADKLGVKKSISNWENDKIVSFIDMLERVADYFEVSTDYLLRHEDKPISGVYMLDDTGLSQIRIVHIETSVNGIRNH